MSISPFAVPFFSYSSSSILAKRHDFLSKGFVSLSFFDFNLFSEILLEWESCIFLDHCFSKWRQSIPIESNIHSNSLHMLSFNIRGFDLRWYEILLLSSSFKSDILILLETGSIDFSFIVKVFHN